MLFLPQSCHLFVCVSRHVFFHPSKTAHTFAECTEFSQAAFAEVHPQHGTPGACSFRQRHASSQWQSFWEWRFDYCYVFLCFFHGKGHGIALQRCTARMENHGDVWIITLVSRQRPLLGLNSMKIYIKLSLEDEKNIWEKTTENMKRSKHQAFLCWNLLNGQASLSGAKWMAQMPQKTRSLRPKIFKIDAPELLRCGGRDWNSEFWR